MSGNTLRVDPETGLVNIYSATGEHLTNLGNIKGGLGAGSEIQNVLRPDEMARSGISAADAAAAYRPYVNNHTYNQISGYVAPTTSVTPAQSAAPAQSSQQAFDSNVAKGLINSAYQTTFGRPAEQGGMDFWLQQAQANPNFDYKSIGAGAQGADILARNDIAAGGVDTSKTWGNGATLNTPKLEYDAANDTWGKVVRPTRTPEPAPISYSAVAPPVAPSVAVASQERWNVTPQMTVQQQAANIIDADSPLMQQARSIALQQMNARGLVNSSMGIEAGQQAVLNSAVDIGKQDANTYASAGQFNAGQFNDLSKFNTGQTNTWNTNALDRTQQTNERLGAQSWTSGEKALDRTFNSGENALDRNLTTTQNDANRTFTAGQSALDRNLTTTQNDANRTFTAGQSALDRGLTTTQKDLDRTFTSGENALNRTATSAEATAGRGFTAEQNRLNRVADVDRYQFDATTRTTLATLSNTYDTQMRNDSAVANAYTNLTSQMAAVDADVNLTDPAAKVAAKGRLTNQFMDYARIRGLNMDLMFDRYREPTAEEIKADAGKTTGLVSTASGSGAGNVVWESTGGD